MQNTRLNLLRHKSFALILVVFFAHPRISQGVSLFGPDTYEECVSDGKVGRTNAEVATQMQMCRKKFPVLNKLKARKSGEIKCSQDKGEVWKIRLKEKTINVFEGLDFGISAKTSDQVQFEGQTAEQKGYTRVKIFGHLDFNEGNIKMSIIDYQTSRLLESIQLKCIEE